jgi:CRISPR-associated endonuclease Csn1
MSSKKILGLDLGTNSIGWALVDMDFENKTGRIEGLGSRIIPMGQDVLNKFGDGTSVSQTAERTWYRSVRRLRERYLLRRARLHRVLNILGFLPEHFAAAIDFENRLGQFINDSEPKLVYDNGKFIFHASFNEMLEEFRIHQPELLNRKNLNGQDAKIPYDWTLYYLRKKALTDRIEKQELAWLILNFNQKRGYYQARGEEDEKSDVREFVELLKVVAIERGEVDKKNNRRMWYTIGLSNGWSYSNTFTAEPKWLNQEKEFLITEELDQDGNVRIVKDKKSDTSGKEKRRIVPLPSSEEIEVMSKTEQDKIYKKIKVKTELSISTSGKTVGSYIYDTLLRKPNQKIRGKLVRTIERKFYREELTLILKKQQEFHPELRDEDVYASAVRELYRNNEGHQMMLEKRDLVYLLLDDIIFYQRPLRSQKSSIANCSFEFRRYREKDGSIRKEYLKAVHKSNPYYQEFRVWQWLKNLRIYEKLGDIDVTSNFISTQDDWVRFFDFLMTQNEVDHKDVMKYLLSEKGLKGNALKAEMGRYRWNYVYNSESDESKSYPCNKTGYEFRKRIEKAKAGHILSKEREYQLWHIVYSVTDKAEYEKALRSFARSNNIEPDSFYESFRNLTFENEYGSFSEKAIRKMLTLMRMGKYWEWESIDEATRSRIDKIRSGEYDEHIRNRVREKAFLLNDDSDFQGLPLWLASYIIYDRHAESGSATKWNTPDDLDAFLRGFKQHSLRNPIVEQVVTETLRVVRDIWNKFGNGEAGYFDKIHVELGREMKNTAEERKQLTSKISENENANIRIKHMLMEFLNHPDVENVRPHSPGQQQILRIYEEGVLNSGVEIPDFVSETLKKFRESDEKKRPTSSEITRYKLWLEQKYRSPYTGQAIPLSKLFTPAYEIEHIIPQSRYFDDSMSNKVICEAAVNKLKDNLIGLEFIKKHQGEKVDVGFGKTVEVFSEKEYIDFIQQHYARNRSKLNKLLLEEIPQKMIERQMNDTRYISKFISELLSNIVREDKDDDGVNSKNLLPGNGRITSELKHDWGLNEVWNSLILPRFERMNALTKTTDFTARNAEGHLIPVVPFELSKGFQKKRIDHRHHAMDALVIACATHDHVNLLNNQSARSETTRYDLQHKLRNTEKWTDKNGKERLKFTEFKKPWSTFHTDAADALGKVVVSFKQNLRVINKATNHYMKWGERDGRRKKVAVEQKGVNWAIRKPMHKETVSGKVELGRFKLPKGQIFTATRKALDSSFDLKAIESITDTGIQKILSNYLKQDKFKIIRAGGDVYYDPTLAFSPEGIDEMNKNIHLYNDGKPHQPIMKVRVFEKGSKFPVGQRGNKKTKYVEAAKGTNLFFAIYIDDSGKRSYDTIPLNEVIERQKQGLSPVPERNQKGHKLLFHLSPNDLVYVPFKDELESGVSVDFKILATFQSQRIYKMVSSTGSECHFVRADIASLIKTYDSKSKNGELGSLNKLETTIDIESTRIKEKCIKLVVDRLGNCSKV